MSYNGSGVFVVNSSGQPVVAATLITAAAFNAFTADVATALSTAILKDGTQTITADIPFNNKKITGLAAGTMRTDAASLATIQDGTGVYVATVGGTADVITLTPSPAIAAYAAGQTFRFIASGVNTTNVTVNVSGLGAKAITKNGTTALVAGDIPASSMVTITYDGTRFILGTLGAATNPTTAQVVLQTLADAKGDLVAASGDNAWSRKAVGADGTFLMGLAAGTNGLHYQTGVMNGLSLIGGRFTVTMAANAITVAIKTDAGNDPSATEPVWVNYRHSTITDPSAVLLPITAALSLAVSSGSTLGTVSNTAHRIYVGIADDASTQRLFVYNPLTSALSVLGLDESNTYTSTAEGGAGGADSAQVLYSGTAFAAKAIRVLGYFESTQVTAGTWATAASKVQIASAWTKKTGDCIQVARTNTGAMATGTTILPTDNTIPQNTEGDEYMTLAVTPTSSANLLEISCKAYIANTNPTGRNTAALFQDTTADALSTAWQFNDNGAGGAERELMIVHPMRAGTTSSTTFKVRAGCNIAGTTTFNGTGGVQRYNGTGNSYMLIEEIFT